MPIMDILRTEIVPSRGFGFRSWFGFGTRWFRQQYQHHLRTVLTQAEAIVRTNSPLPDGLLKCSQDAPNARDRRVLRKLSKKMSTGMGLADAMDSLGSQFPAFYVDQIRAGEVTGRLGDAMRSIIEGINAELESGRALRNHALYFFYLAIFTFGGLSFLAVKVIPVFVEILREFDDRSPPLPARALLAFFGFLRLHGLAITVIGVVSIASVILIRALYRFSGFIQSVIVWIFLSLPTMRGIYRNSQVQRLSRVLELRLSGGIPLSEALHATAASGLPRPYRRMLERCAADVERGTPLSSALAPHVGLTGRELTELVRLGESREDLVWSFQEAGAHCARAIRRAKRVWVEAMVPIGVGLCAVGVATAAVTVFGIFTAVADGISADL